VCARIEPRIARTHPLAPLTSGVRDAARPAQLSEAPSRAARGKIARAVRVPLRAYTDARSDAICQRVEQHGEYVGRRDHDLTSM
jgi:hypothetical protein